MQHDNAVFTAEVECTSCNGKGVLAGYPPVSCAYCGGHGTIKEHITVDGLKDEMWLYVLNKINSSCMSIDDDFVDVLLSNPTFIDKLLEKVGHRMEPEEA